MAIAPKFETKNFPQTCFLYVFPRHVCGTSFAFSLFEKLEGRTSSNEGYHSLASLDPREFDLIGANDQHFYRYIASVAHGRKEQWISK